MRTALAQWRLIADGFAATEPAKVRKLVETLRRLAVSAHAPLVGQVIDLQLKIEMLRSQVAAAEHQVDELVAAIYGLTPDERMLVTQG